MKLPKMVPLNTLAIYRQLEKLRLTQGLLSTLSFHSLTSNTVFLSNKQGHSENLSLFLHNNEIKRILLKFQFSNFYNGLIWKVVNCLSFSRFQFSHLPLIKCTLKKYKNYRRSITFHFYENDLTQSSLSPCKGILQGNLCG